MSEFRILVTGSRTWEDEDVIYGVLDILAKEALAAGYGEVVLVHGHCPDGADLIADGWAIERRREQPIRAERHPARWKEHGRKAGFLRNQEMVDAGADVCVAFLRGESRGTRMCAELAERAGITVQYVEHPGEST